MSTSGLDIVTRMDGGVARLVVSGELDLATAPELLGRAAAALDSAEPPAEVDLGGVTFIDGSGLRCLLAVQAGADGRGGLELVGASGPVRRLFGLTGLSGRLVAAGAVR
ncbi:MAG TPA: STAS domain-containing protein [Solirubrobacteraceae bacterium]|nr:STAS domain-containing protein [Solirubrobacteraceae bacterium]